MDMDVITETDTDTGTKIETALDTDKGTSMDMDNVNDHITKKLRAYKALNKKLTLENCHI